MTYNRTLELYNFTTLINFTDGGLFQNEDFARVYKVILQWLCIKVARGQKDRDVGTRLWGLRTWGRETRELGTLSMGRGDIKNRDAGDAGCE